MIKYEKGTPGYLREKLKIEILRTVVYFAIVIAVFLLGYSQTHSKKNLLTVVAVVGCLPACKALVGVIMRIPYKTVDPALPDEIGTKAPHLTVIYDLVVTSTEKIMPIDCMVISHQKVYGYTTGKKADLQETAAYLRKMLRQNDFPEVSVKMYDQYKQFLSIVEGLENIAAVEKADTKEEEGQIAHVIMNLSL